MISAVPQEFVFFTSSSSLWRSIGSFPSQELLLPALTRPIAADTTCCFDHQMITINRSIINQKHHHYSGNSQHPPPPWPPSCQGRGDQAGRRSRRTGRQSPRQQPTAYKASWDWSTKTHFCAILQKHWSPSTKGQLVISLDLIDLRKRISVQSTM